MDWLNSALTESDEEEEEKSSKTNLNNKSNDNFKKFVEDTVPFPKVIQSTETTKETHKKDFKYEGKDSKKLNEPDFGDKDSDSDTKNQEKEKSALDLGEFKSDTGVKKSENDSKSSKKLFSIETKTRKVQKFEQVKIKSQELSESEMRQLSQTNSSSRGVSTFKPVIQGQNVSNLSSKRPGLEDGDEDYEEKLDYNEALESFNKSNVNFEKLLKSNQWLGPKVKIKDIRAEDLHQSKIEKERNYTCNKEILYEGSKRFTLPTRLMETEDGQVITTNVARRTQKRKHQINWLAMEAQDKEMEIMEQTAHMRKSKRETQMKYGW